MINLFGEVLEGGISAWVENDWCWEKEKREKRETKNACVCTREREDMVSACKGWDRVEKVGIAQQEFIKIGKSVIKHPLMPTSPLYCVISPYIYLGLDHSCYSKVRILFKSIKF